MKNNAFHRYNIHNYHLEQTSSLGMVVVNTHFQSYPWSFWNFWSTFYQIRTLIMANTALLGRNEVSKQASPCHRDSTSPYYLQSAVSPVWEPSLGGSTWLRIDIWFIKPFAGHLGMAGLWNVATISFKLICRACPTLNPPHRLQEAHDGSSDTVKQGEQQQLYLMLKLSSSYKKLRKGKYA